MAKRRAKEDCPHRRGKRQQAEGKRCRSKGTREAKHEWPLLELAFNASSMRARDSTLQISDRRLCAQKRNEAAIGGRIRI